MVHSLEQVAGDAARGAPVRAAAGATVVAALALIGGCGGGGDPEAVAATQATERISAGKPPPGGGPIVVTSMKTAQTHVLPPEGLAWQLAGGTTALHLVGGRDTLVMVGLADPWPSKPRLDVWRLGSKVGSVALSAPSLLPATAGAGPRYGSSLFSATLPASLVQPGISITVGGYRRESSAARSLTVGMKVDLELATTAFYLFGANDTNAPPLSSTGQPDAGATAELFANWPVSAVKPRLQSRMDWPQLVLPPDGTRAAMVVRGVDESPTRLLLSQVVWQLTTQLRAANGDSGMCSANFSPMVMLNRDGGYAGLASGWGAVVGGSATGPSDYGNLFFHETGHALGLLHSLGAYQNGQYPYYNGTLLGSEWGYDSTRREFVAPFRLLNGQPVTTCDAAYKDALGRCAKTDVMQGGAEFAAGYRYALMADFNAGRIQTAFLEGLTTVSNGARSYSGGCSVVDVGSPTGYSRWDGIDLKLVPQPAANTNYGWFGLEPARPAVRDVPVARVVVTHSYPGSAGATQVYPPSRMAVGNLPRLLDPTDPVQLASIQLTNAPYRQYCTRSGCDYTLRVRYADGAVRHVLLQGGYRPAGAPTQPAPASAANPLDANSYRQWAVNVPAPTDIVRVELLDTPMAWTGLPVNPVVLAAW